MEIEEIKKLIGKIISTRDTQECHNCDTVIADIQFDGKYYVFLDSENDCIVGIKPEDIEEFVTNNQISYKYNYFDRKCSVTFTISENNE